jgi:hypothetical protein
MFRLQQAGFETAGEWLLDGDRIKLSIRPEEGSASVYAFVLDGEVVYIGKTETCLRSRMNGYRNGKGSQVTNVRVRGLIRAALTQGSRIEVLAASPAPMDWNGLPVSTVVGLEAGLIELFHPVWNQLNNRQENSNGKA